MKSRDALYDRLRKETDLTTTLWKPSDVLSTPSMVVLTGGKGQSDEQTGVHMMVCDKRITFYIQTVRLLK